MLPLGEGQEVGQRPYYRFHATRMFYQGAMPLGHLRLDLTSSSEHGPLSLGYASHPHP